MVENKTKWNGQKGKRNRGEGAVVLVWVPTSAKLQG